MRKIMIAAMILIMVLATGCWQKTRVAGSDEYFVTDTDPIVVQNRQVEVVAEPEETEPEAVVQQSKQAVAEKEAVDEPDCDGRLIPTYDINNEITGYRCVTASQDFECPGHRAGETWTEKDGCTVCTCRSDGSITCTDANC